MSVTVTHLLDSQTPEDSARLVSLLLRASSGHRLTQRVLLLGTRPPQLQIPPGVPVEAIAARGGWPLLSLPALRRAIVDHPPHILHALGLRSAASAGMLRWLGIRIPVVTTVSDPHDAPKVARWWQTLQTGGGFELLCTSRIVQRRLVEAGVPAGATR